MGEWVRGLSLGFTNPVRIRGVCLCMGCGGVGGLLSAWMASSRVWENGVVLCLCVL